MRPLLASLLVFAACKADDPYPVGPQIDSGPRQPDGAVTPDAPVDMAGPTPDAPTACITKATLTGMNLDIEAPPCTLPTVCTVIVVDPTMPSVVGAPVHVKQGSAILTLPGGVGAGLYVVAMVPGAQTCQHEVDVN